MTGISCRSSDRKKPKKYHKKPKKNRKIPKKTEKSRKIPKKTEKNRTLPQISNLGLVFFGFFRFFSVFFGLQPPLTHEFLANATFRLIDRSNYLIKEQHDNKTARTEFRSTAPILSMPRAILILKTRNV